MNHNNGTLQYLRFVIFPQSHQKSETLTQKMETTFAACSVRGGALEASIKVELQLP